MTTPAARTSRPWTAAEEAKLASLVAQRLDRPDIAVRLDRTTEAITTRVREIRKRGGIAKCGRNTSWTPEQDAAFRDLWADGVPTDEIGRRIGKSKNSVCSRRKTLGLEPRGPTGKQWRKGPQRRGSTPAQKAQRQVNGAKARAARMAARGKQPPPGARKPKLKNSRNHGSSFAAHNATLSRPPKQPQSPTLDNLPATAPAGAVSMADAMLCHCRYPVAWPDPVTAEAPIFCGAHTVNGGSWCEKHARAVLTPAARRAEGASSTRRGYQNYASPLAALARPR